MFIPIIYICLATALGPTDKCDKDHAIQVLSIPGQSFVLQAQCIRAGLFFTGGSALGPKQGETVRFTCEEVKDPT